MEYKITNIVANGNLGFKLSLNKLALSLDNTEYEPEKFPGLIYRMTEPKATFLIYSSGKFIVTGIKNKEDIEKAIEKLTKCIKI